VSIGGGGVKRPSSVFWEKKGYSVGGRLDFGFSVTKEERSREDLEAWGGVGGSGGGEMSVRERIGKPDRGRRP